MLHRFLVPVSVATKLIRVLLHPLNAFLSYRRDTLSILASFPNNLPIPICYIFWVEGGTVRVNCLAKPNEPGQTQALTAWYQMAMALIIFFSLS